MPTIQTQGFTLDNSGKRVVVDPICRIEGHLRIEVNLDKNNVINNAVSTGTPARVSATPSVTGPTNCHLTGPWKPLAAASLTNTRRPQKASWPMSVTTGASGSTAPASTAMLPY